LFTLQSPGGAAKTQSLAGATKTHNRKGCDLSSAASVDVARHMAIYRRVSLITPSTLHGHGSIVVEDSLVTQKTTTDPLTMGVL
jgi:hypothetical protein